MPTRMSAEQFDAWRTRRKRWTLLLDTSEALLMVNVGLWGLQLVFVASGKIDEPVSRALLQVWPRLPLPLAGAVLIGIALLHLLGIRTDNPGLRRRMIMGQMTFFCFAWLSFLLARLAVPGVWVLPAYVLACIVNYFSLLKPTVNTPPEQEKPCKPDR